MLHLTFYIVKYVCWPTELAPKKHLVNVLQIIMRKKFKDKTSQKFFFFFRILFKVKNLAEQIFVK